MLKILLRRNRFGENSSLDLIFEDFTETRGEGRKHIIVDILVLYNELGKLFHGFAPSNKNK